jgi:hypothetical protein
VLRPDGRLLLVNFTKKRDRLTLWERAYAHTPEGLAPYLFGSCRPVRIEPFVREAGLARIEREFLSGMMASEVVLA